MISYTTKFDTKDRTMTLHNETLLLLIGLMEEEGWVTKGSLVPGKLTKADKESIRNYQLIALTRLRSGGEGHKVQAVQQPIQYTTAPSYTTTEDYIPAITFEDSDFE